LTSILTFAKLEISNKLASQTLTTITTTSSTAITSNDSYQFNLF
jgi:hypothetical protein